MRLYKICNKYNIRNIFFNEKIMAPTYYDDTFYNYKLEESDESQNCITLYTKIPEMFLSESTFVIEIEIKLKKGSYINDGIRYFILNNIYLDDNDVILKRIYYFSEKIYRDLITEITLIGEAKLYDKYKAKFTIIDRKSIVTVSDNNFKNLVFEKDKMKELLELEKKKAIEYDSLKGSLYLITKFYPKVLIRSMKEIKMSQKILEIRKLVKKVAEEAETCNLLNEKALIKKVLDGNIKKYRIEISKDIINNAKNKKQDIFTIYGINGVNVNFGKNALKVRSSDEHLVNKIINIILNAKLNKSNNIGYDIISELGNYCKNIGDNQLYNDARILYSVIVKRNLNSSYKNIQNDIMKFLYLALEYHDSINTLNSIISDYKFTNYYMIYSFVGLIVGFEKLNKIYTDNQKLDVFNTKFDFQLKKILKRIDEIYGASNFYRKNNYEIIQEIIQENKYYKFIERCESCKKDIGNIKITRKSRNILIIWIDDKYKLCLNKTVTKKFLLNKDRLKIKYRKKSNEVFSSFEYTRTDDKVFQYYDEIELNIILKTIMKNVGLSGWGK